VNTLEQEAAATISKVIGFWMNAHRKTCFDPDCVEPLNLLALLAHRAGMRVSQVPEFRQHLARYEAECAACEHLRN
jgi:hypothetical protein